MSSVQITVEEREHQFFIANADSVPDQLDGLAEVLDEHLRDLANNAMDKLGDGSDKQVLLAAMKSVRRICVAWRKYPGVNGFLGGAQINSISYLHTALDAVAPSENAELPEQIAKLLGQNVAYATEGTENDVLEQTVLAAHAAHKHWYDIAQDMPHVFEPDDISEETEPHLRAYTAIVSQETADRVKSEQEKEARKQMKTSRKLTQRSSPAIKSSSVEVHDALKIYTSGKIYTGDTRAPTPAEQRSRKRKAAQNDGDADESPSQSAPKKHKTADGTSGRPRKIKVKISTKQTLGEDEDEDGGARSEVKTTRKPRTKPPGDPIPWLRDEHDSLNSQVQNDPNRVLDYVYREHNKRLSGTPYRNPKWAENVVAYRPIFVECTDTSLTRNEQRERDIAPRSFWAIRNQLGNNGSNYLAMTKEDHGKAAESNAATDNAMADYVRPRRAWSPKPVNTAVGFAKKDGTFAPCPPQGVWLINSRDMPRHATESIEGVLAELDLQPVMSAREQYQESRERYEKMMVAEKESREEEARMAEGEEELREFVEAQSETGDDEDVSDDE